MDPHPSPPVPAVAPEDRAVVKRQLRRLRYEPLRVAARCHQGYPAVVEGFHPPGERTENEVTSTSLDWITCPWLERQVQRVENEGWLHHLRWLVEQDGGEELKQRIHAAAEAYTTRLRARFDVRSPGLFEHRYPGATLGIGGTKDPVGLKCLHNHAASYLAGTPTPLGELALALVAGNLEPAGQGPLDCGRDCMQDPAAFGLEAPCEV